MKMEIRLQNQIDAEQASELVKESAFVSDYVRDMQVDIETATVSYRIMDEGQAESDAVSDKVSRFVTAMTSNHRDVPSSTIIEGKRTDTEVFHPNAFDELAARGWLHQIGTGHVSLCGPALALFEKIDAVARDAYDAAFAPEARHFPAMIPGDTLAKCGYFDSHPNNVSFVSHLRNDFDVIEGFRQQFGASDSMEGLSTREIVQPCNCLNPAACLPSYFTFQGSALAENRVLSWMGRVFRYESTNVSGLERLWEYNVRELVFLGDADFVSESKARSVQVVADILQAFDLEFSMTTSTDPFFATVAAIKKFWQKSTEAKYEVKIAIGADETGASRRIAAGSINYHDAFFGRRFDITAPCGDFATSGCVGLGIERILLSCFVQHGFEPRRWPDAIRTAIF